MNEKVEIVKRPVEKVGDDLKKTAWASVFESFATILLGILLVAWSDSVVKIIAYAIGTFFIIKGGYYVVNYFITKGNENFFNNELLTGIITIIIGITAFVLGEEIGGIFRVIAGIWLIYEALIRMNRAIKLHHANVETWRIVLITSLLMLILGTFVTFTTGAVVALIGWILILGGLIGVFTDVIFIQNLEKIVKKITKIVDEM